MVNCPVYTLTLLANASIIGVIGAFAMIKHEMAKELELTESFLGTDDYLIQDLLIHLTFLEECLVVSL